MAGEHDDHGAILDALVDQLRDIFDKSKQGMYVYLDDNHAVCNKVLAGWQGYKTPKEWAAAGHGDFLRLVDPASRDLLVKAYREAMKDAVGAQIPVAWVHKDGKRLRSNTILVPIDAEGHRVALHFVSPA